MRMTDSEWMARGDASPERQDAERVEVWCASLDQWVRGFDLVSTDQDGCILRRLSDGEVLPIAFSEDAVRPPTEPVRTLPVPWRDHRAPGTGPLG
jgi:hypothetical protein